VDMYIPSYMTRECCAWTYSIFCVRPLQVCSFNESGQCEGLNEWYEQQYRPRVFFILTNQKPKERVRRRVFPKWIIIIIRI